MIKELLSQIPELSWTSVLVIYGPMGAMLAWFAMRAETKQERLAEEVQAELRVLGHRINGMARALLFDVASRDNVGHAIKAMIDKELAALNDEAEVKEIRGRSKHPIPPKYSP